MSAYFTISLIAIIQLVIIFNSNAETLVNKNNNKLIINQSVNLDTYKQLILNGKYSNQIEISNQNRLFSTSPSNDSITSLIELFFPQIDQFQLDLAKPDQFNLEYLNLTSNELTEKFLVSYASHHDLFFTTYFHEIVINYFSHVKTLDLSSNNLNQLARSNFDLFTGSHLYPSHLEHLYLSSNRISYMKHDTFYGLNKLKHVDLSHNRLKMIHPLTFINQHIESVNLISNSLKAVYPIKANHLYLSNNDLECDYGLSWLQQNSLNIDDFKCKYNSTREIQFKSVHNLDDESSGRPEIIVDTRLVDESSQFSILNLWSKKWFAWNVFRDDLPVTTPYPYLASSLEEKNETTNHSGNVYHTWYMSDLVLKCSTNDSKSKIIWKTQYGYLSNLEEDAYKIFYQFDRLTKISKRFSVVIGQKFGGQSTSEFEINKDNELKITNMRQAVSGQIVCIAVNQNGISTFEYNMHVRTGMGENFINSILASLVLVVITLTVGIISCCILEYKAKQKFPDTPPYYPTPMANTPPNFDFNEWMSNAASYLPNINIHDTLEQVSKKLRKGMEKATVTVKSLGLSSTAYIYSVYEHSSQRWSDIKSYVPTLNVPTITLPTMKYPPVSQLANRMRTGVGNIFIPMGKFCGTSDLSHTVSINDLQSDMNASNTIGNILIIDERDLKATNPQNMNHYQGYYRFLKFLREESRKNGKQKNVALNIDDQTHKQAKLILVETPETDESMSQANQNNDDLESQPTTSAAASVASANQALSSSSSSASKPKINLIVAFLNNNSKIDEEDDEDEDDE